MGETDFSCMHELRRAFYAVHNLAGSVTYVVHREAVLLVKKSGAVIQLYFCGEKKERVTVPWKGLYIGKYCLVSSQLTTSSMASENRALVQCKCKQGFAIIVHPV